MPAVMTNKLIWKPYASYNDKQTDLEALGQL